MKQLITNSPLETQKLSQSLLKSLNTNIITFKGDLGAGKTTLIQSLGQKLGIGRMTSPTFTIIKEYLLTPSPHLPFTNLYHVDLYRLTSTEAVLDLGLKELWSNPQDLLLIEWPELIENLLPQHLQVNIKNLGQDKRQITITTKN